MMTNTPARDVMIQSRIPAVSIIPLIFSHKLVSVPFSGEYGPCIILELVSRELLVERLNDSSRELPVLLLSRIIDFVSFVNSCLNNTSGCATKETQTKSDACVRLSSYIF